MKCVDDVLRVSEFESPPFGEVWIEILIRYRTMRGVGGHLPSGRCGLKLFLPRPASDPSESPPFGEVWIEMHGRRRRSRPR